MHLLGATLWLHLKVKTKRRHGRFGIIVPRFRRYSKSSVSTHQLLMMKILARLDLLARKQRAYDAIPPTRAALKQHVMCAAYQAACVWSQATVCHMQNDSPANWGWYKESDIWHVLWSVLTPISECCQQLTRCGCKGDCRGRCKCFRLGLNCTQLCGCKCND